MIMIRIHTRGSAIRLVKLDWLPQTWLERWRLDSKLSERKCILSLNLNDHVSFYMGLSGCVDDANVYIMVMKLNYCYADIYNDTKPDGSSNLNYTSWMTNGTQNVQYYGSSSCSVGDNVRTYLELQVADDLCFSLLNASAIDDDNSWTTQTYTYEHIGLSGK